MSKSIKDVFDELEWQVWPGYAWHDHGGLFKEPTHRFETPETVDRACQLNEKAKHQLGECRKTGPTLEPLYDSGAPRLINPESKQHSALFMTFAQINYADRDEILGFAMTYGLLGLEWESHINWAHEICQMKEAVDIAWSDDKTPEQVERLRSLCNVHLRGVVSRFQVNPEPCLTQRPETLLALMWLRFSQGLERGDEYRKCKHCDRMFEISLEQTGFRRHRAFCSDECKSKDYEQRKRTAKKLWKSGMAISKIAKQVETDPTTVRGWVEKWKGAR